MDERADHLPDDGLDEEGQDLEPEEAERERPKLPFGSEFTPRVVNLPELLELIDQHQGSMVALRAAVRTTYFERPDRSESNTRTMTTNLLVSIRHYDIIDADASFTDLGRNLFALRGDEPALHERLATYILREKYGAVFVQSIQDMRLGGHEIDLPALRRWLIEQGMEIPRGTKHLSSMRGWLGRAGVVDLNVWEVNEARFSELLGTSSEELDVLAQFTPQQRAYLKTLANLPGDPPFRSNEVERTAATSFGVAFNEKSVPNDVLFPLVRAGYITLERGERNPGRGGRPYLVSVTDRMQAEVVVPLLEQLERLVRPDLRPLLRLTLADIEARMDDPDRNIRGLALEAFAIRMMRTVDLQYVGTRKREVWTGGAEVDAIFEGMRLVFSRWQIQCKRTAAVSLEDVAKEVGLTHTLRSNVIVVVTTGRVSSEARRYARQVMTTSNLCIVIIDGTDVESIIANPNRLIDVLDREAHRAMQIKKLPDEEAGRA